MSRLHVLGNRFPIKHAWDAAAVLKILLGGQRRLACLRFYFESAGVRNLYAIGSRSGMVWSLLGMSLAWDLANGGDGEYRSDGDMFWPTRGLNHMRFDWRVATGEFERMYEWRDGPVFGEHWLWVGRLPYYRLRSARLKEMGIVLVTRSILAALDSRFHKFVTSGAKKEVSLDDERSFDWDRYLSDAIAFHNSWGDVLAWHPKILHLRYEDLKRDPVTTHMEMMAFWGKKSPRECVKEAFRRVTKKEMLKRMPMDRSDNVVRVSTRPESERGKFSEDLKNHLRGRLERELIHTLGYDYNTDTGHFINYD